MERLTSLIPDELKRVIGRSAPENLTMTSSLLLDFLRPLPQFQQVIRELTDPDLALCRKSKEAALGSKQKGNECFMKGDYVEALSFYSHALRHAPANSEMDVNLVATLYVNRASTMHKLGLLQECIRDCNRAISIFPAYVKAWYRRGKANASLKDYKHATHDLEVAVSMEDNPSRKSQIKGELSIVLSESSSSNEIGMVSNNGEDEKVDSLAQSKALVLQCVSSPHKGRGLTSAHDIPPASLVHHEEPLAAILLKSCRETHCHFCFDELPADILFCPSCTIPVYCSKNCQEQAFGKHDTYLSKTNLATDLEKHVMNAILANPTRSTGEDICSNHILEHRHECGGAHWSAVLPPDIVLAARLIVTSIEKCKASGTIFNPLDYLDFVHNYAQNPSVSKLELHVYAIVLLYCLHQYYNSDFPLSGASVAQVKVAQAIYSRGSLFNHSCQPNVHAYFLSRTLFVRSVEVVPAWCPLELSYGPQAGELDLQGRQKLLEEQYSFQCRCSSCSELNLSDLVMNSFRCVRPYCLGAVLEATHYKRLESNFLQVSNASGTFKLSLPLLSSKKDISDVARMLLHERGANSHIAAGHCMSCGSCCDLECSTAGSKSSLANIQRLKDSLDSDQIPDAFVSEMLSSLSHLRSVRHPYSKIVAEADDNVAEAFVRIGELKLAVQHCVASIEILEKLYGSNHIVMGHELMKLASIQLCTGDRTATLSSIDRVESIFLLYYGSHVDRIFPHLKVLRTEAERLAS
uniref:MYND-type domain-containing protein n=1 Tax=Musa acuminata subsp. malaccensis TaxID=214687 RepID=A0A804IS90_MUSAM